MAQTRFELHAASTLASAGFCILDSRMASRQRPDLWVSASDVDGLNDAGKNRMRNWPDVRRYTATMPELGPVEILAKTDERLPERIYWVTGLRALQIQPVQTQPAIPAGTARPTASAADLGGDRYAGVATAEGPRTCYACEHYTAGRTCLAAAESGMEQPRQGTPRRCLAFKPEYDATDGRNGRQLWPELIAQADASPV